MFNIMINFFFRFFAFFIIVVVVVVLSENACILSKANESSKNI